jgi:uncharacterized damage-inducible protein DinB
MTVSPAQLLSDGFNRVRDGVARAVDGLSTEQLAVRVGNDANSIGWLVWHLTRVQDDHVAAAFGRRQVWQEAGWHARFGLPYEPDAIGYGHTSEQVGAAVGLDAGELAGYHEDVHRRTLELLEGLEDDDLERIVDTSFVPPVTLAVRLMSVLSDDLQHVGQAAFVRGLLHP